MDFEKLAALLQVMDLVRRYPALEAHVHAAAFKELEKIVADDKKKKPHPEHSSKDKDE